MINPNRVEEIFIDCLFEDVSEANADGSNVEAVEGLIHNVGFNREKISLHKAEIIEILNQLPVPFKESGGGGWSFLNMCNENDGTQWTGLQQRMEQLYMLGIAIKYVKCLVPREMWEDFPGGVPYLVILDRSGNETNKIH